MTGFVTVRRIAISYTFVKSAITGSKLIHKPEITHLKLHCWHFCWHFLPPASRRVSIPNTRGEKRHNHLFGTPAGAILLALLLAEKWRDFIG
jgi:hypothetical protein